MKATQQTLTGRPTLETRTRPSTMLWCEECDDAILRSDRFDHEHDLDGEEAAYEKAKRQEAQRKVPEYAQLDTRDWIVTFHDTHVEQVRVEATDKHDAKEIAREERTYNGEIEDTVHTERRPVTEPSAATIEYLENRGLLSDDHDVTQEDIERLTKAD